MSPRVSSPKALRLMAKRRKLEARAEAYREAAEHLGLDWTDEPAERAEGNRLAVKLHRQADKILRQRPPLCRLLPYSQWCDANGRGDFMGHTCEAPKGHTVAA